MQTDQWHEEGPWLLLMVLPLCALAFRRGVLLLLVLVPLLTPYPVHAMSWRDMWHTRDQQAQALMQQHHPAAAAALFSHPQWKAAALYRAEKYTGAAKVLDGINQSDALYNRGNALARAGDLGGAIAAYNQALRRDASNADARTNRDLIKKLLRQKQKQPRKQRQNKQRKTNDAGKKQQEQERQSANKQGNHRSSSEQHTASPKQNGASQTQQQNRKQNRDGAMPGAGKKKQQKKQQRTVKSQNMNKHNGTADAQRKTAAQSRRPDEKRIESEKAVKQWLRRIPDDPGGLLRRKFEYQYRNRQQRQAQSGSDQAW
jgi:Ca-activated chloride channel family protein